jgi:hypothetical protein
MNEIMKKNLKSQKMDTNFTLKMSLKNGAKNFFFALPIDVYNTITKKKQFL